MGDTTELIVEAAEDLVKSEEQSKSHLLDGVGGRDQLEQQAKEILQGQLRIPGHQQPHSGACQEIITF